MMSVRRVVLPVLVLLAVPVMLPAATMKQTVAVIAVPKDAAAVPLQNLIYKAWFTAEVKTVRLDPMPAADADPVEANWVFTGLNTDGQLHRISITLTLVDETGGKLATFYEKTALRPGAKDQTWSVHMKVPAKVWAVTRTVRIGADWFS